MAAVGPGQSVLDVGCGPGTVTRLASTLVGSGGGGRVVGVDLAEGMLERAAGSVGLLAAMDARRLGFGDGVFDVVVANSVIQFAGPGALVEWVRVCRDGGRVAYSLPWGPTSWYRLLKKYWSRTREPFRSSFEPRVARLDQAPDASRARALPRVADVSVVVDPLVARYESAEAAWQSHYRHGSRVFLEELEPDALAEMHAEFLDGLPAQGEAVLESEFRYCVLQVGP